MYLTRVLASLLACTALVAPAVTQGKPFKDALPADTLAFFSVPDLNTSLDEFQNTALAKMWREDEVQDFVADALKMAEAKWAEGFETLKQMNAAGQFPVSPDDIMKLRLRSISGALTSVKIQVGDSGPEPKIGFLLHLDFGDSAATWRKLTMVGVEAMMAEAHGDLEKSESKLEGDVQLITLTPHKTEMSLNVAFVGNGVVLGTIKDEVVTCVNAITGQKTILPVAETYRATAKYLDSAGAEMEAYIHVEGIIDFLVDALEIAEQEVPGWPEQLQVAGLERAFTALGMRSVKALGFTSKYEGSKAITRGFILAPEESRKGLFLGKDKALDFGFLKWVPKDVASLAASHFDISRVYDGLVDAIKDYNPELADELLAKLKQKEEEYELDLRDDFFGVFGNQMVWWSMGVQNFMSAPEGAMLLKVKDQDKLLATLNKVSKLFGGAVEFPSSERKGIRTWRLELNPEALDLDPTISQALSFLQPCFAFKNGYMVMALATGDVRKAMKRMDREDDPKGDVRSNKEFAAYLASMQQEQVISFDWNDWKVSFENLYSAATSILGFAVSADEVPFDLTLLPEAETLSQHLYSSATWSTSNKDGYISTSISPIGPEIMLAVVVGAGAGAMWFGMSRAAERPEAKVIEVPAPATDAMKPRPVEETKSKKDAKKDAKKKIK